jgi:type II secretory pathway pseudopilin PulG
MRSLRRTGRRGITLTEILISIMILGIGLLSLATLFPLGLVKLRDANRAHRATWAIESAASNIEGRGLLDRSRFLVANFLGTPYYPYDPFIQDTPILVNPTTPVGIYRGRGGDGITYGVDPLLFQPGTGLPVVYDPLWRSQLNSTFGGTIGHPNTPIDPAMPLNDGRFAYGIGLVRPDPSGGEPAAHGLQRVTNFPFGVPAETNAIYDIFGSPDDYVYQTDGKGRTGEPGIGAPVVPDLSFGSLTRDLSYTWIFTGQRSDATNATIYDGNIVVFHNRPIYLDSITRPFAGDTVQLPAAERVVEAVFAYSTVVGNPGNTNNPAQRGYSLGDDRIVLLRWPASTPDPDIRVGSWIADVTYERYVANDINRFRLPKTAGGIPLGLTYPGQRCYWYRVIQKSAAILDPGFPGDPGGVAFRQMTVTVDRSVQAKTLLDPTTGAPVHVNAALVSPYVVQVIPRVFYAR